MNETGQHTTAQAQAAFGKAQFILERLVDLGVELPHFDLFVDGSGRLILETVTMDKEPVTLKTTNEQYEAAQMLVRSRRGIMCSGCILGGKHSHDIGIEFCHGLIEPEPTMSAEERHEKLKAGTEAFKKLSRSREVVRFTDEEIGHACPELDMACNKGPFGDPCDRCTSGRYLGPLDVKDDRGNIFKRIWRWFDRIGWPGV